MIAAGGKVVHEATGTQIAYAPEPADKYVRIRGRAPDGGIELTEPVWLDP